MNPALIASSDFALRQLGWRVGAVGALVVGCMSSAWAAQPLADTTKPAATAVSMVSTPAATATAAKPVNKPGWNKLSSAEQRALKPLAGSWDSLNPAQQRKWLEISKNYPSLPVADQAKMHGRMSEWAALSTQERAQARLNFGKTSELSKELSPAEKRAKWEAYQSLPSEEKQKLSDKVVRKPLGAAPATQPVAPHKLATLPAPAKPTDKSAKTDTQPALPKAGPATGIAAKPAGEGNATP